MATRRKYSAFHRDERTQVTVAINIDGATHAELKKLAAHHRMPMTKLLFAVFVERDTKLLEPLLQGIPSPESKLLPPAPAAEDTEPCSEMIARLYAYLRLDDKIPSTEWTTLELRNLMKLPIREVLDLEEALHEAAKRPDATGVQCRRKGGSWQDSQWTTNLPRPFWNYYPFGEDPRTEAVVVPHTLVASGSVTVPTQDGVGEIICQQYQWLTDEGDIQSPVFKNKDAAIAYFRGVATNIVRDETCFEHPVTCEVLDYRS